MTRAEFETLIADIEQLGGKSRFDRAEHRCEHLDQIEARLGMRVAGIAEVNYRPDGVIPTSVYKCSTELWAVM